MNTHKNFHIWIFLVIAILAAIAIVATSMSFGREESTKTVPISGTQKKTGEIEVYDINKYESEIEGTDLLDENVDFEADALELEENDAEIKAIDEGVEFDMVTEDETSL